MLAARSWLHARALTAPPGRLRWHVEITLAVIDGPCPEAFDENIDTRFRIEIYSEEWGFFFCHQRRASWIRVTDIPFVHGRDDFGLLGTTPGLKDIGALLRTIEATHQITFRRERALVRTNLEHAEPIIRRWVATL